MLASCNNSKTASCTKVLLSECVTIGLQLRKHATRCSQVVVWLVWMGLMSAFQNDVRNSGKMNTFLGIFAGVNECSLVQNSCLLQLDLVILWLKVAKNYGVAEIRVFLGRIFGVSLAQGGEETWYFQNLCLSACLNFILLVSSLVGL